ncbi:MAG: hypothetical protein IH588_10560 [Anaerolineales bacterium]|nr:hypothetical protein [Anaerolineales bacterium]
MQSKLILFEGIARLSDSEYQDLLARHSELTEIVQEHASIRGDDYLLKYRKLQNLYLEKMKQSLIDELSRFDVYDGLPMDEYCRLALDRWQDFCESAKDSGEVTLMECCYLQNPLTVMLARHDADQQIARQHIEKLTAVIYELNPLVIYLQPRDVTAALQHVRSERPKEWVEFVTWYLTGQEYGKAHHLSGYEGVIQFYEMRQKLETEVLHGLPIQQLVVKHSGGDWERCALEIVNFIKPFFLC